MYSTAIRPKVEKMFSELQSKVKRIIAETDSSKDAVNKILQLVSTETASRSKSILSDMLFDLNDDLMKTSFFSDISRQNKFMEKNLRQEILNNYQFATNISLDYDEATRIANSLKLGGGVLVIGGIGSIGVVLIKGLSLSSLVPIPISIIVAAALGTALVNYFAIEPNKSKMMFEKKVNDYLSEAQQQFLNWFDEVENYFNKRVEEIKQQI